MKQVNVLPKHSFVNRVRTHLMVASIVYTGVPMAEADAPRLELLASRANGQIVLRVHASPCQPFTLETATNLAPHSQWSALLTTNTTSMLFDHVVLAAEASGVPQRFYRARRATDVAWDTVIFRDDFDDATGRPDPAAWIVNQPAH